MDDRAGSTTTVPVTYHEQWVELPGVGCTTSAVYGSPDTEWAPTPTQCMVEHLPDLPATDGAGYQSLGYRFEVVAHNDAGAGSATPTDPVGGPLMSIVGPFVPAPADPLVRIVTPRVPDAPIIEIDAASASGMTVDIPGYVSVPMGRVRIDNPNSQPIKLNGGIAAGTFDVNDPRATSVAGNVTSVAVVQINSDGTTYGINSWTTR